MTRVCNDVPMKKPHSRLLILSGTLHSSAESKDPQLPFFLEHQERPLG